jgi:hypothetical protein
MSRGPGRVMQVAEDRLTAEWRPLAALAADVFDTDPPTPSQVESVRRAVRRLVQLGRATTYKDVQINPDWSGEYRSQSWKTTTSVRHPLTPQEPPTTSASCSSPSDARA